MVGDMSRLPYLRRDDLDPDGEAVWDAVVSTRGQQVVHEEGHLTGPFNALLHSPGVGLRVADLGAALRYHSSIDDDLLQIVILTVAVRWKAEYEWWAHAQIAVARHVPDEVIAAIGRGETPSFGTDGGRVVHAVARQLVDDGQGEASTPTEAQTLPGDQGLVELVALCGYYTLISFGLNAFHIPLPDGVAAQWGD
jgi:4-carboxymuconolactone decarboxylase